MTLEEMIEEYKAKGGTVTQVGQGARAISSARRIYAAMREGGRVAADDVEACRKAEDRVERENEAFRAAKYDGWTDADALDYAQNTK